MKISESLRFAEEQAGIEHDTLTELDLDRQASWADTLEALRIMKERGVPDCLEDESS